MAKILSFKIFWLQATYQFIFSKKKNYVLFKRVAFFFSKLKKKKYYIKLFFNDYIEVEILAVIGP